MMNKRGLLLQKILVQIILVVMIFAIFLGAMNSKFESRGVKQQVLEKQFALLIGAASEGMSFEVRKKNDNGLVDDISVRDGKIFVSVDGLPSSGGYSYFSRYRVSVEEEASKFIVRIG